MDSSIIKLPTNSSLSLYWNFGSLLLFIHVFQTLTGLFLVFFYSNDVSLSFNSVQFIMYEVNFGWLMRLFHFNGASFFFFLIFFHFLKGLYYFSYRLYKVWFSGLFIFLFLMMEAFMGYVLVWAQMSFWASVVITSLLTVIPFIGFKIVFWIWGGFSVSNSTLKFFFVFHFLLPWVLMLFILLHLMFLHSTGSTSKLYMCSNTSKINFYPFFWLKDLFNIPIFFVFFFFLLYNPFSLGDSEMFLEADYLNSPVHIVPEWYFLFAYAILRSIPNKMLGVIFLLMSILFFFVFLFMFNYKTLLNKLYKLVFMYFLFIGIFLSWLGQCLVEYPFYFLGIIFTILYFVSILLLFFSYILSYFIF